MALPMPWPRSAGRNARESGYSSANSAVLSIDDHFRLSRFREGKRSHHDLSAYQIAMTTRAMMMVPHTAGVTRFELPLRGESLSARSNLIGIPWDVKADPGK
jgi:hypothetical protein